MATDYSIAMGVSLNERVGCRWVCVSGLAQDGLGCLAAAHVVLASAENECKPSDQQYRADYEDNDDPVHVDISFLGSAARQELGLGECLLQISHPIALVIKATARTPSSM